MLKSGVKKLVLMNKYMTFLSPTSRLLSVPLISGSLVSEALFGEAFEVTEKNNLWAFGKIKTDGYEGWVKLNNLGSYVDPSHRVIVNRTIIYINKNIKSALSYLSLGSQVSVFDFDGDWATIRLPIESELDFCYILKKDIVKLDHITIDWVKIAESFLNTPYFWGGRSSLGLDCSALVQLSLQTYGINCPRDSNVQKEMNLKKINDIKLIIRGDLLYWTGHVAIAINNETLIHANAFHLKTNYESISKTILRLESEIGAIQVIFRLLK